MMDYNIFRDGCLVGTLYREDDEWLADNRSSTEVVVSIREYTKDLKRKGYIVKATPMAGLVIRGE